MLCFSMQGKILGFGFEVQKEEGLLKGFLKWFTTTECLLISQIYIENLKCSSFWFHVKLTTSVVFLAIKYSVPLLSWCQVKCQTLALLNIQLVWSVQPQLFAFSWQAFPKLSIMTKIC